MRADGRSNDEMRPASVEYGVQIHAAGSVLVRFGNTHVLCAATVERKVPPFLEDSGMGWITAEYRMLPASVGNRVRREADGRAREIQRLVGRSLRRMIDLAGIPGFTIRVDCDVVNGDGGTRTAAITGAALAVARALEGMAAAGDIAAMPEVTPVAAVSCGIVDDEPMLDLSYEEDSRAAVDANFVVSGDGAIIEVQATGEERGFSDSELSALLALARSGTGEIFSRFWAGT